MVVGGGFTGLWAAILARELDPTRDVVLLEQDTVAFGASGRNGGFCDASLTHGLRQRRGPLPRGDPQLERLGAENFEGIRATIERYGIDCDWSTAGDMAVAVEPYQVDQLRRGEELPTPVRPTGAVPGPGGGADRGRLAHLPRAGCGPRRHALVDPAALAWGLRRAALELGVRIHERTRATGMEPEGDGVAVATPRGRRPRAAGGSSPRTPSRRWRARSAAYVIPVYDYVLMTEPLTPAQMDAIGWRNRQGLADAANQFHYYRLPATTGSCGAATTRSTTTATALAPELEDRPETFDAAGRALLPDLPAARGRAVHASLGGRDRHVQPLLRDVGDGARRAGLLRGGVHGARRGLEPLRRPRRTRSHQRDGDRSHEAAVRPLQAHPFPPEPLRYAGIQLTRRAIARADEREGRRGPWLRADRRHGPRLRQLTARSGPPSGARRRRPRPSRGVRAAEGRARGGGTPGRTPRPRPPSARPPAPAPRA